MGVTIWAHKSYCVFNMGGGGFFILTGGGLQWRLTAEQKAHVLRELLPGS